MIQFLSGILFLRERRQVRSNLHALSTSASNPQASHYPIDYPIDAVIPNSPAGLYLPFRLTSPELRPRCQFPTALLEFELPDEKKKSYSEFSFCSTTGRVLNTCLYPGI